MNLKNKKLSELGPGSYYQYKGGPIINIVPYSYLQLNWIWLQQWWVPDMWFGSKLGSRVIHFDLVWGSQIGISGGGPGIEGVSELGPAFDVNYRF